MLNILDQEEVKRLIQDVNSPKNIKRKRDEYINFEIGESGLKPYVKAKLADMYPKNHTLFTVADYSIVKKIRNKKSKAYKDAPTRKLDVEGETSDYAEILKEGRFNDAMKIIDKFYNQHNYCGMFFETSEMNDKLKFYPLAPYEFDVVKDDNGNLICLILSYPGRQVTKGNGDKVIAGSSADEDLKKVVYSFWTKENHVVVEVTHDKRNEIKGIDFQELPGNPQNINPYGIIPFSFLPYDFNEDYPAPSKLPDQTIEFNSMVSTYLTSANEQKGQLVLSYPKDQPIGHVSTGIMTAITLPQSKEETDKPSTAQYISPNPNLAGHKESIFAFMMFILDENDINSDQVVSGPEKFTSALDRMISQADVQHIIEDNQESYVRFEQEAFNIINAMTGGYFKSTNLTTIYVKPKLLTSDTEKLNNIKQRDEMGMLEAHEKLILDNPNLTVEEAKAKLLRINEEKRQQREALNKIEPAAPVNDPAKVA